MIYLAQLNLGKNILCFILCNKFRSKIVNCNLIDPSIWVDGRVIQE